MEIKLNPNKKTLWLEWEGDLVASQNGGLVMAEGWDQVKQRIMRRLFTNNKFKLHNGDIVPPEYIFHSDYGLGFRRRLGEPVDDPYVRQLESLCNNAVMVDEGVDPARRPDVEMNEVNHKLYVEITVYLKTRQEGKIEFAIPIKNVA